MRVKRFTSKFSLDYINYCVKISLNIKKDKWFLLLKNTVFLCEHLGGVGGDGVEDVDQDEEEGDQEGHPTGDHVHRDQERDPRHDHKQACVPRAGKIL